MTRDDSPPSLRLVGLLLAVTAVSLAIATFAFFSDNSNDEPALPPVPDEPSPQGAPANAAPTQGEPHDSLDDPRSPSQRPTPAMKEKRKEFLQALARSAEKQRSAKEKPSEAPAEPPETATTDQKPARPHQPPTRTDDLRERWEQEANDPSWTNEMQQQVGSLLREHEVEGAVDDVSCRETVCRVDVDFSDIKQAMELAQKSQMKLGPHWIERSREDGELGVRIFVEREAP